MSITKLIVHFCMQMFSHLLTTFLLLHCCLLFLLVLWYLENLGCSQLDGWVNFIVHETSTPPQFSVVQEKIRHLTKQLVLSLLIRESVMILLRHLQIYPGFFKTEDIMAQVALALDLDMYAYQLIDKVESLTVF